MILSTYIKEPYWTDKKFNDYIKKSNDDYMKLSFKCNQERKLKNILWSDNPTMPPSTNKNILFSGILFLSLSSTIYYFYSTRR